MKPTGHSPLGGSGAYRWLMCPGSVALLDTVEEPEDSSYSLLGTAAHNLGEECIRENRSPYSCINGGTVTVEKSDGGQIEVEVDADMAAAVMTYIQHVKGIAAANGSEPLVETDFHMDWVDPELWGRNDFKTSAPFDTLYVYDYKHGAGVGVEVSYDQPQTYYAGGQSQVNPQLMYYALGALGPDNVNCIRDIEVGIVQPRKPHADGAIRAVRIPLEEVYRWRDEVLIPGIAATREEKAPCISGSWCQFCDAVGVCPAVFEKVSTVTRQTAADVFAPATVKFPAFPEMTPEMKAALVEYKPMIEKWLTAMKSEIDKEILGGAENPGLKIVNGNKSRAWVRPDLVEQYAVERLGDAAYTPRKLNSPAQMEEALTTHGQAKEAFYDYIEITQGKKVVPVGAKGAPVSLQTAADVFAEEGLTAPAVSV